MNHPSLHFLERKGNNNLIFCSDNLSCSHCGDSLQGWGTIKYGWYKGKLSWYPFHSSCSNNGKKLFSSHDHVFLLSAVFEKFTPDDAFPMMLTDFTNVKDGRFGGMTVWEANDKVKFSSVTDRTRLAGREDVKALDNFERAKISFERREKLNALPVSFDSFVLQLRDSEISVSPVPLLESGLEEKK